MRAVVAGPDRGIEAALRDVGVETVRIEGVVSGAALNEADVADADLYVLTDVGEATSVAVALELNPSLRVFVYSPDTIPEFVRGQVEFALDPALFPPETVAEELVRE